MINLQRIEEINSVCIGYSGQHHWQFFRQILANPDIKNICMIGVYYGRDIAYMKAILQELGRNDCMIVGVDKFEDRFCDDWPEEKRNLSWQEAGFGQAPNLQTTRTNLLKLGLSGNVFLVSDLDVNFLQNTVQIFDLIYIDTSHDYESVKNLINLALAKVSPNGFLAGDDFSDEGTWGVAKAVRECFPKFQLFYNWIWLAKVSELKLNNTNIQQINSNQIASELEDNKRIIKKGDSILCKLISAYEEEGYCVSVGLNPHRENSIHSSFAVLTESQLVQFFDQPTKLLPFMTGGGISVDEILCLESILKKFNPKYQFLLGVAAGWSTIAMGLINPQSKLYAIDNCSEGKEAETGIILTDKIAKKLNLDLSIFIGSSPHDIPIFLDNKCPQEKIDFALIDGLHTNEQIILDFKAILPYLSTSAIVVFHDVLNFKMLTGFDEVKNFGNQHGFKSKILRRTASGIGILYRNITEDIEALILSFYQHPYLLFHL